MLFLVKSANRNLGVIHKNLGTHSVKAVNHMPSPVIISLRSEVNVDVANQPLFESLGNLKGEHTNI